MTHIGQRESLVAAGVDRIVEVRGRRFGLLQSPAVLLRLRRERFDEVVIPQMTAGGAGHGNLYRLAAGLGARAVTIVDGTASPQTFARSAFRRRVLTGLPVGLSFWRRHPLVLLALLAAARLVPRRDAAKSGRRRVLHVISTLEIGGAQRQLTQLLARTPSEKYAIDVLVLGRGDGEMPAGWLSRGDIAITRIEAWPHLVSAVFQVRQLCCERRYDIVHSWLFMGNVVGVGGARLAGVPHVIASVRGSTRWSSGGHPRWWFRAADALCARAADLVTANAGALAAEHAAWAWYARRRIRVIHNGLEPSDVECDRHVARARLRRETKVAGDTLIVGTVGRLVAEKDHLTFLRVIRHVRQRLDVHAVIVGDGPLRDRIERAAGDMGLAAAVTFLGRRDDACAVIAGFDLFLLTSAVEGFPNALLEAVMLGIPAVASRVGAARDVLPEPGDTFLPGDCAAAARRVSALLQRPRDAAATAAAARQRASTCFTAARSTAQWLAVYDRDVPGHRVGAEIPIGVETFS